MILESLTTPCPKMFKSGKTAVPSGSIFSHSKNRILTFLIPNCISDIVIWSNSPKQPILTKQKLVLLHLIPERLGTDSLENFTGCEGLEHYRNNKCTVCWMMYGDQNLQTPNKALSCYFYSDSCWHLQSSATSLQSLNKLIIPHCLKFYSRYSPFLVLFLKLQLLPLKRFHLVPL